MSSKPYDLDERTFKFAKDVRQFIKSLNKTLVNMDDCKQLLRASGSVGANYIEAIESLSPKDKLYRLKICRKEAKEAAYWLRLLVIDKLYESNRTSLSKEAKELLLILATMIKNKGG